MILDQHDELVQENDELRRVKERYHACDKEAAVLRERLNSPTCRTLY